MSQSKVARRLRRPAQDFLLGLLLFAAIAISGLIDTSYPSGGLLGSPAHAGWLDETLLALPHVPSGQLWDAFHNVLSLLSVAVASSLVIAFNLWFARHLRQVHASYRRRR